MVKSTLTEQERADKRRAQARERQRRFHEKNKNNPEYLAKRKLNDQKITKMMKEHPTPTSQPKQNTPEPTPAEPTPQPTKQNKNNDFQSMVYKINKIVVGKYPLMTAQQVQEIYKTNKQYALKGNSTEQIGEKTFKEYAGAILSVATIINGKDDFIGAFVKAQITNDLIKNNKKPDGSDYQPTSPQKWYETIFTVIRLLKRAGYLDELDIDKIIKDKYDSNYRQYLLKKSIQKKKDADNIEFAVPTWDYFEAKIIEDFGANSIQHLITVLYRYNAVRNDFVKLPITNNKNNENGFYVPRTGNIKVLKNSHKSSGVGHSSIDFTYNKEASAVIRAYIKNNNLKVGDMLLPDSVNDIVVDMLEKVHIKYPPTAKPVSVMRNIDSGVGDWNDIDVSEFVNKASRSKHSVATRLHTYRRIQLDFNIKYPLKK